MYKSLIKKIMYADIPIGNALDIGISGTEVQRGWPDLVVYFLWERRCSSVQEGGGDLKVVLHFQSMI